MSNQFVITESMLDAVIVILERVKKQNYQDTQLDSLEIAQTGIEYMISLLKCEVKN